MLAAVMETDTAECASSPAIMICPVTWVNLPRTRANDQVLRSEIDEGVRRVDLVGPGSGRELVIDDPGQVQPGDLI